MAKLGKRPLKIPDGVTISYNHPEVCVKGPKGELRYELVAPVVLNVGEKELRVEIEEGFKGKKRKALAFQGLTRALINNMITGVKDGFERKLEIVGMGYKVELKDGKKLVFSVGFSHPVIYEVPKGVDVKVERTKISLFGIDKQLVGQVAAEIRRIKPPEPYKGKGIRYEGEEIMFKEGKTGAK